LLHVGAPRSDISSRLRILWRLSRRCYAEGTGSFNGAPVYASQALAVRSLRGARRRGDSGISDSCRRVATAVALPEMSPQRHKHLIFEMLMRLLDAFAAPGPILSWSRICTGSIRRPTSWSAFCSRAWATCGVCWSRAPEPAYCIWTAGRHRLGAWLDLFGRMHSDGRGHGRRGAWWAWSI